MHWKYRWKYQMPWSLMGGILELTWRPRWYDKLHDRLKYFFSTSAWYYQITIVPGGAQALTSRHCTSWYLTNRRRMPKGAKLSELIWLFFFIRLTSSMADGFNNNSCGKRYGIWYWSHNGWSRLISDYCHDAWWLIDGPNQNDNGETEITTRKFPEDSFFSHSINLFERVNYWSLLSNAKSTLVNEVHSSTGFHSTIRVLLIARNIRISVHWPDSRVTWHPL